MAEKITFGEFLCEKRKSRGVLMTDLADELGVSKVYLCDVEKGRKAAPKSEYLQIIADYLELSEEERNTMYDLAAEAQAYQKGISPDLPEYIMENDIVRTALRTAKKYNISDSEWLDFIRKIETSVKNGR